MTPVTLYLALFGAALFLIFTLFAFILLDPLIPTASDFETRRPQQKRKYSSLGWLFARSNAQFSDEEQARLLTSDARSPSYDALCTTASGTPRSARSVRSGSFYSPGSPDWPDSPLSILVNWRPVRWASGRQDSVTSLVSPRRVV